ncbi:hypothetical protein AGR2A_pa40032 [Agrobacterium genomosp. 2 str. CFBP 5494]|uniref:Uncharacterized protein n=1 Tax=Agrobacterium genomosp. 2 str. CFBP 5494 TaxID=1183436 RepID=A0A9W5B6Q8_9HYPH|nr:hypothetical protein AGR2A_pa40032 [Agrobacterium genomosp. 2 str. CFBP 5494]
MIILDGVRRKAVGIVQNRHTDLQSGVDEFAIDPVAATGCSTEFRTRIAR